MKHTIRIAAVLSLLALTGCTERYRVATTNQAIVRYDTKTGQAWVLVSINHPPRWLAIEEPKPR